MWASSGIGRLSEVCVRLQRPFAQTVCRLVCFSGIGKHVLQLQCSAETLRHVQGSIGFLTGSLLSQPLFVLAPSVLIDEWFGMFVGYVLGSLCFLSGSFIGLSS